jgi:lipoyl(octanoyl) transferase
MIDVQDWGLIDYNEAWQRQKQIVANIQQNEDKNVLALCEHPAVITIGKNGTRDNITINSNLLDKIGIKVIENDRGGDVTLHNPGQLVGYTIFNLQNYKTDLHWFLREIEQTLIELLLLFNIQAHTIKGFTGVWVKNQKKICAIGLHCSRWITSHGFALNVINNLDEFNYIIPCGIKDKEITSIVREIGTNIDFNMVKNECKKLFEKNFN